MQVIAGCVRTDHPWQNRQPVIRRHQLLVSLNTFLNEIVSFFFVRQIYYGNFQIRMRIRNLIWQFRWKSLRAHGNSYPGILLLQRAQVTIGTGYDDCFHNFLFYGCCCPASPGHSKMSLSCTGLSKVNGKFLSGYDVHNRYHYVPY